MRHCARRCIARHDRDCSGIARRGHRDVPVCRAVRIWVRRGYSAVARPSPCTFRSSWSSGSASDCSRCRDDVVHAHANRRGTPSGAGRPVRGRGCEPRRLTLCTASVAAHTGKANVANALTLPGGTIVMLDGLDDAVDDDDALVGVFGHELGHIAGRVHDAAHHPDHWRRRVGQYGVWGDMSSLLLNGVVVCRHR